MNNHHNNISTSPQLASVCLPQISWPHVFSLGTWEPQIWDSQQRFRARLLWLLPLLQDLANHIPEGLDNLIKSHHVAVYCLALHHKIWIWSFIRSYHMYVYIYIISCHVISYEIQSYHIISYHIYIIYFMSFHFMIIFYSIILYYIVTKI